MPGGARWARPSDMGRLSSRRDSADDRLLALREADIGALQERYLDGELSLEEFETEVAGVLHGESPQYAERWEVHVYGAPPGHQLHIHL
jgi:hypothetical protein